MTFRAIVVALAVVASFACSGSPTAPTPVATQQPPAPAATPRSFSVVSANVKFGVPAQFRAVATYSDASSVDVTERVKWSSSTDFVSVSANGVLTYNTFVEQEFLVHAEWNEPSLAQKKVSSPWVTMEANPDVPGEYLRLNIEVPTVMMVRETKPVAVIAFYSNGVKQNVTSLVTGWAQVNLTGPPTPYNVFVSRDGMAKAEYAGKTKITTSFGKKNAEVIVTVEQR